MRETLFVAVLVFCLCCSCSASLVFTFKKSSFNLPLHADWVSNNTCSILGELEFGEFARNDPLGLTALAQKISSRVCGNPCKQKQTGTHIRIAAADGPNTVICHRELPWPCVEVEDYPFGTRPRQSVNQVVPEKSRKQIAFGIVSESNNSTDI
jgi:hypothetical protein